MSKSLKQDIINTVGEDNFIKHLKEITNNADAHNELLLFRIQFDIPKFDRHYIKFTFAENDKDAKKIIVNLYRDFGININSICCEQMNIRRGMMFNA